MAGIDKLFAPAFRHRRLGWLFTAIVAIMVYIATFAMAAEAALSSISLSRGEVLRNHLTVEIPAADESSTTQEERVKQALAVLRAMPDVTGATQISEQETARLLKPWISDPELIRRLPLPALIDVAANPDASGIAGDIEEHLSSIVSDARVDDHAAWMSDLSHFIEGLSILAAFMIALTGLALVIVVGLICRAVMATERETVELLHIMGAGDDNIAMHFQFQAWRLSRKAALIGFALAAISLALLLFAVRHFVNPFTLPPLRWISLGLLLILVPLAAVGTAVISARMAALKFLQPVQ